MKKALFFIFFAGAFIVSMATAQEYPTIRIVNNTGYVGYYLYVSQTAVAEWEEDLLEEDILPDGGTIAVRLGQPLSEANRYDIQLEDEDGDTYTKWNVLITPNALIEFTLDDLD
ncbi:MAG: hypothetical protein LBP42_01445 [Treponema sp.]|jgi:hypothetical protein|nr:hypothetical protein [Treponema sp.]